MAVKFLLCILCLSITCASAREGITLKSGTQLEVRVVSVLNKKAKKEKIIAFAHSSVVNADGQVVLIEENAPVRITVDKKKPKKNSGMMEVRFVSVQSASGKRIDLTGTLYLRSRVVGKGERRDKLAENLTWAAFGYIPSETLPKKIELPEVTVTNQVFVVGDYTF